MQKTTAFVAAAVVIGLVAWLTRPVVSEQPTTRAANQELFPAFTSALQATSLAIDEFDEATGAVRPFKVAKVGGEWIIPSHQNYPADAKEQLGNAAANLVGLRILGVEGDTPADHANFGVIAPLESEIKERGMKGVGTRVTLGDANEKVLFDAILGAEVKGQAGQRYLRIGKAGGEIGKDPVFGDEVYAVAVKTDKLSTKFETWIERDLLKMSAFDMRRVVLKDYSVDTAPALMGGALVQAPSKVNDRSEITLNVDDSKSEWSLVTLKEFDEQHQAHDVPLAEDEELNTAKLNALKTALTELKIVDVERKPPGLGGDLDSFIRDREGYMSLFNNGFFVRRGKNDQPEILCNDGEFHCRMKDGVEYVLRFGAVASIESGKKDKSTGTEKTDTEKKAAAAEPEKTPEASDSPTAGRNRYLFVMAQFDPETIPKPVLDPLPEAKPAEAKPEETKAAETKTADANSTDTAKAETTDAPTQPVDPERQRIEKENRRKQDDYDAKVKTGQDHAKKLNDRFSDWYYIVSDDVYRKIQLGRSDVIKKKEAKQPAATSDGLKLPGMIPQGHPE